MIVYFVSMDCKATNIAEVYRERWMITGRDNAV